jgi:hypothetical protein
LIFSVTYKQVDRREQNEHYNTDVESPMLAQVRGYVCERHLCPLFLKSSDLRIFDVISFAHAQAHGRKTCTNGEAGEKSGQGTDFFSQLIYQIMEEITGSGDVYGLHEYD